MIICLLFLDRNTARLSVTCWTILQLLKPVMEPFMRVQKLLEGETYVTGSLVVPHNYDLQEGLNKALVDLRESAPPDSRARPRCGVRSPCVWRLS